MTVHRLILTRQYGSHPTQRASGPRKERGTGDWIPSARAIPYGNFGEIGDPIRAAYQPDASESRFYLVIFI